MDYSCSAVVIRPWSTGQALGERVRGLEGQGRDGQRRVGGSGRREGAFFKRPTRVGRTSSVVGRESRRRIKDLHQTQTRRARQPFMFHYSCVVGLYRVYRWSVPAWSPVQNVAFCILSGAFCILR